MLDGAQYPHCRAGGEPQYILQAATEGEAERAEEELARAQKRNIEILESITDGFMVMDREWRFVYVNSAAEQMVGASREEVLGKNHWELYPGTRNTQTEQDYRRAVREGVPVESEIYYEPWGRWFAIKAYPTQQGGLSVFFRDITASRRTAEQLRESEQRFSNAFAQAPSGHGDLNPRWTDSGSEPGVSGDARVHPRRSSQP